MPGLALAYHKIAFDTQVVAFAAAAASVAVALVAVASAAVALVAAALAAVASAAVASVAVAFAVVALTVALLPQGSDNQVVLSVAVSSCMSVAWLDFASKRMRPDAFLFRFLPSFVDLVSFFVGVVPCFEPRDDPHFETRFWQASRWLLPLVCRLVSLLLYLKGDLIFLKTRRSVLSYF